MTAELENDSKRKSVMHVDLTLAEKGGLAHRKAKRIIQSEKVKCSLVKDAMLYFMRELKEVKHPGLLSLSCEAVGGRPDDTGNIGAALLFLLGSAHIHDDIIDQSRMKRNKATVYGRFGQDIALLVGDAFLLEGMTLLNQSCEGFPAEKRKAIADLTKDAFFEIGCGEADEVILRKKHDLSARDLLECLEKRAAMSEAAMRIGALIGDGKKEDIEDLGHYGRTLGLLAAIREEFVDIFEPTELKSRYEHQILPLPITYASRDLQKKRKIMGLLRKPKITEEDAGVLVELVMNSKEVQKLREYMRSLVEKGLTLVKNIKKSELLEWLLLAMVENI